MVYFQIAMTIIIFFAVIFLTAWVFRPGSSSAYSQYSKIPLNKD